MRTFLYCRVSTTEQTTENQILAAKAKGWDFEPQRIVTEQVSGSVKAMDRKELGTLIEHKLEKGDRLVVLKLDRLGRDVVDVVSTIDMLRGKGVSVISLDLEGVDLASPAGRLQLTVLSAVAEFERNRIKERTAEGVARAMAEGKRNGRPLANVAAIKQCKESGMSQSKTAKELGLGIATVKRHWNQ